MATVSFRITFGYSINAGSLYMTITNFPFTIGSGQIASAPMDVYTVISGLINAPFTINLDYGIGPYFGGLYGTIDTIAKTMAVGTVGNTEVVNGTITFMTT